MYVDGLRHRGVWLTPNTAAVNKDDVLQEPSLTKDEIPRNDCSIHTCACVGVISSETADNLVVTRCVLVPSNAFGLLFVHTHKPPTQFLLLCAQEKWD